MWLNAPIDMSTETTCELGYTYEEKDLLKKFQQMVNCGYFPTMQNGRWGIYNDGGIGHYYLVLYDFKDENRINQHIAMLGENIDASYIALCALDSTFFSVHYHTREAHNKRESLFKSKN